MQCSKSTPIIDANVILRYLLNDHAVMSPKAKNVIDVGARTKPEVIAEVVYVLRGVYEASREDICTYIRAALRSISCTDGDAIDYAIDLYAHASLDFIDCLLISYHVLYGDDVFSFDKKLNKKLREKAAER